jgi:hypothetical protein
MTAFAALEGRMPTDVEPVPPDLAISPTFTDGRAVGSARRELNSLTADGFGSFVEAATAQPWCDVIDFAELAHLSMFDQVSSGSRGRVSDDSKVLEVTGYSEVLNADRSVPISPERVPSNIGSLEPGMLLSRLRPRGRAVAGGKD